MRENRIEVREHEGLWWMGRFLILYTALFGITSLIYFSPLFADGRSLIWYMDGSSQHYMAYVYFGHYLREAAAGILHGDFTLPMWDFSLGFGSDILSTLSYYIIGDPLGLLTALVPTRYMEGFYCAMILVRLYLSGVSFSLLCRKLDCSVAGTAAGAMIYVFAAYTMANVCKHPYFANPMIYLPLLLLGVERIYRHGKPALFITMVAVSAMSNFYFFYMLVIEVVIYAVVRYAAFYETERLKRFFPCMFRFLLYGACGTAVAGVILLPSLIALLGSERMDVSGGTGVGVFYTASYYARLWLGWISGDTIGRYTLSSGAYTYLGYGSFALPAVAALLGGTPKKKRCLKVFFIIGTLLLLFPAAGRLMNGFAYPANRWAFAYGLLIAFIVAAMWEKLIRPTGRVVIATLIGTGVYAAGCVLLRDFLSGTGWWVSAVFVAVAECLVVLAYLVWRIGDTGTLMKSVTVGVMTVAFAVTVLGAGMIGYVRFLPDGYYTTEFNPPGTGYAFATGVPARAARELEDGTFFRFGTSNMWNDGGTDGLSDRHTAVNGAALTRTRGISYYFSLVNPNVERFLQKEMGTEGDCSAYYVSMGKRSALQDLLGVRYYFAIDEHAASVPENFYFKQSFERDGCLWQIWENPDALPFAVLYDTVVDAETLSETEPLSRDMTLLHTVSVPAGSTTLPRGETYEAKELPFTIDELNGVTVENGRIEAEAWGTMHLSFEGEEGYETSLQMTGVRISSAPFRAKEGTVPGSRADRMQRLTYAPLDYTKVRVAADGGYNEEQPMSADCYLWYSGKENYVWPLVSENAREYGLTITFTSRGVYEFDTMKVMACDLGRISNAAQERKRRAALEDAVFTDNAIHGTVHTERDALLCLSLPYTTGWRAYVDGERVETVPADTMLTGIALKAGDHRVELRYCTPGLRGGALMSGCGLLLFAVILAFPYYHKRRGRGSLD